jgi:hypothetical protein
MNNAIVYSSEFPWHFGTAAGLRTLPLVCGISPAKHFAPPVSSWVYFRFGRFYQFNILARWDKRAFTDRAESMVAGFFACLIQDLEVEFWP